MDGWKDEWSTMRIVLDMIAIKGAMIDAFKTGWKLEPW